MLTKERIEKDSVVAVNEVESLGDELYKVTFANGVETIVYYSVEEDHPYLLKVECKG